MMYSLSRCAYDVALADTEAMAEFCPPCIWPGDLRQHRGRLRDSGGPGTHVQLEPPAARGQLGRVLPPVVDESLGRGAAEALERQGLGVEDLALHGVSLGTAPGGRGSAYRGGIGPVDGVVE